MQCIAASAEKTSRAQGLFWTKLVILLGVYLMFTFNSCPGNTQSCVETIKKYSAHGWIS